MRVPLVSPLSSPSPPPPEETFRMPQSTLETGDILSFYGQGIVKFPLFALVSENVGVPAVGRSCLFVTLPLHQALRPQLLGKSCKMQYASILGYKCNPMVAVSGVASFAQKRGREP